VGGPSNGAIRDLAAGEAGAKGWRRRERVMTWSFRPHLCRDLSAGDERDDARFFFFTKRLKAQGGPGADRHHRSTGLGRQQTAAIGYAARRAGPLGARWFFFGVVAAFAHRPIMAGWSSRGGNGGAGHPPDALIEGGRRNWWLAGKQGRTVSAIRFPISSRGIPGGRRCRRRPVRHMEHLFRSQTARRCCSRRKGKPRGRHWPPD